MSNCECYVSVLLTLVMFAYVGIANTDDHYDYCNDTQNNTIIKRFYTVDGDDRELLLYWGSEPAHAASALLAVILRHKLGYQQIKLVEVEHQFQTFASNVPFKMSRRYNEGIMAISTAWEPALAPQWKPYEGFEFDLAGPRLIEFGYSSVPVRQRLYVHLEDKYQRQELCRNVTRWSFYTNATKLKQCGFSLSDDHHVIVYGPASANTTVQKLRECDEALRPQFIIRNRAWLFQMIQISNESFLFVDYDMWSGHPTVNATQLPPCVQDLNTLVPMRVGDVDLINYAPELFQVAHDFAPSPGMIREILELQSKDLNIERAACEWASNHTTTVNSFLRNLDMTVNLIIYYVEDDPNYEYDKLLTVLVSLNDIINTLYYNYGFKFDIQIQAANDAKFVKTNLEDIMRSSNQYRLIGALVGGVNCVTDLAKSIDLIELPVLFYDAPGIDADATTSTWITNGRTLHLALAMHHFCRIMNWTRVGVLSEPTATAKRFVDDLRAVNSSIAFGDHTIQLPLTQSDAENILKNLKEENAHIILVNTNYKDAVTILSAAAKLKMNKTKEYAWIVRDWRPNNTTSDIQHFIFSFLSICGEDNPNTEGFPHIKKKINNIWANCKNESEPWPLIGTALANAVLTMVHGYISTIKAQPQKLNDLYYEKTTELFGRSLIVPFPGLTHTLKYRDHSVDEVIVYMDKWQGQNRTRLMSWRINATSSKVTDHQNESAPYFIEEPPPDGSSLCFIYSGDRYWRSCYDLLCILLVQAILFIILSSSTYCIVFRRNRKKRLLEKEDERRKRTAALSAGYLIDRSALTLLRELGAGRFGFVHLAVLRVPQSAPRYVAAKVLRDHEAESEILREACILASVKHEHIICLVGVCIDKDSPLVLMEVAFFGDLLQYLCARRYLVEETNADLRELDKCDEEAAHVSAEALTQLARQAASALEYLSQRSIIHRDLRAANCLVDAHRSLKLADFGLARETMASDDGAEYACRRRGLFPVLWMAPESLEHGIFSAASDIWALGVLILELVTLGERPFGDMSPFRVMQFVAAGGKPPIPRDATPQTVGLARLCWQREPEKRPTAAEVVAYLAERSSALRPALDCDHWRAEQYILESPNDTRINNVCRSARRLFLHNNAQKLRVRGSTNSMLATLAERLDCNIIRHCCGLHIARSD